MNKFKKFISSPVVTIVSFALAAVLLVAATTGGARAALKYYSETYDSRVKMFDIGVSLLENDKVVASRDYDNFVDKDGELNAEGKWDKTKVQLLEHIDEKSFVIGKNYKEEIKAKNSGTINEYVRVTLYTYWAEVDDEGTLTKVPGKNPAFIELNEIENPDWIKDESSSTSERKVYYYGKLLKSGETTSAITDTLKISDKVTEKSVVSETTHTENGVTYTDIVTSYEYDGLVFVVEAEVDAVQEHNAEDAILSAWGRTVTIKDQKLTLK